MGKPVHGVYLYGLGCLQLETGQGWQLEHNHLVALLDLAQGCLVRHFVGQATLTVLPADVQVVSVHLTVKGTKGVGGHDGSQGGKRSQVTQCRQQAFRLSGLGSQQQAQAFASRVQALRVPVKDGTCMPGVVGPVPYRPGFKS